MTPEIARQILELVLQNFTAQQIQEFFEQNGITISLEDVQTIIRIFNQ